VTLPRVIGGVKFPNVALRFSLLSAACRTTLWKEEAPPAQNIQLSKAILAIRMEEKDPAGEYKVTAKKSDLNAGISFELETRFRVK